MEIRRSKARFLSIFFIVALGVAFFSGIQASSPDMRYSGDAYYDENSLMDLKVVSTLGLTSEDEDALREIDGIEDAEGAYFTDVTCGENEKQTVLHIESLTKRVNQLTVTEGRLPQKSGELFLDDTYANAHGYKLGDQIVLREQEDSSFLGRHSYTVTAIGKSPLYISFNRGNTTLGTGEVNGFAFILPEDFDQEVYTQIYLLVHGAKDVVSYTDAYDILIRKIKSKVEGIQDVRCEARYQQVTADAQKEITDGEQELADGRREAEEKLADARQQLIDGRKKLTDGQKEYEDGVKAIEDAKGQLKDGQKQLEEGTEKLEDARQQLSQATQQVQQGEQQLSQAQQQLDNGNKEIEKNQQKLEDGLEKLQASRQEYEAGVLKLTEARQKLEQSQSDLDARAGQVSQGKEQIQQQRQQLQEQLLQCQEGLSQVETGEQQLAQGKAALDLAKGQLTALIMERDSLQASYDAGIASGEVSQEELAGLQAQIAGFTAQIQGLTAQIQQSETELTGQGQQLAATRTQLESSVGQINGGLAQLDEKEGQLNDAQEQIQKGQEQINQGREELKQQEKKLADAKKQLDKAQKELDKGKEQIQKGQEQAQKGQQEIDANAGKLAQARIQISQNTEKLQSGEQELEENRQKLIDGQKELQENEQKLKDSKQELEDGEKDLSDGEKEYQESEEKVKKELADNQQKLEDAKKKLADLKVPTWTVTDRNDLPEYSDYGDNAERIRNIGKVFPVIFFLVAALISLTTMTRMVEEQRTQIGTMKALGYGKAAVAAKYICYALLATIGGSILGFLVGEKIIPYVVITSYGIMYHNVSDTLCINYEMKYTLIASGASIICTVGATMFACVRELRETPASLMRPPAPKEGKRILAERITFLWKHLSFTWKSTLRNLFRYKKRLFMTVFGIAGSMGLMLVGFGLRDSIMNIAVIQYRDLQHYEGNVIEDEDADEEQRKEVVQFLKDNQKVDHCTSVQFTKMNVPRGSSNLSVYVIVPEDMESFKKDVTLQNRITKEKYLLSDKGAAICEKTADLLGLKAGDVITLKMSGQEYRVPVEIITENYMAHYVYISPSLYESVFQQKPDYQNLFFTMKEEYKDDLEAIGQQLLTMPGVLSISYTSSLAGQLERMLTSLDSVILVLIISAGMLAFVVLYNLNNINITERQRELATLKVLGFYDQEVSQYVFRENILLTVAGVLVGVLFGIFLHRYVITTVEVDAVMFGRNINPISFLYSGLITCGFSLFVNFTMHFKLKKINMVESLKSVE